MTAVHKHNHGVAQAGVRMYDVMLQICPAVDHTHEELEAFADAVEDVCAEFAADLGEGFAAACNFTTPAVELDFTVHVAMPSEIHHRVGGVLEVLERDLGVTILHESQAALADNLCVAG